MRTDLTQRQRHRRAPDAPHAEHALPTPDVQRLHKLFGNGVAAAALGPITDALGAMALRDAAWAGSGLAPAGPDATFGGVRGLVAPSRTTDAPLPDPAAFSGLVRGSSAAPLPEAVASKLSAFLDHDLSHVRVHADAAAAEAAKQINAKAFALGADIFLGQGVGLGDTRTVAEEAVHVKQFDQGRLPKTGGRLAVSKPTDSYEAEARAIAGRIAAGDTAAPSRPSPRHARQAPASIGLAARAALPGASTGGTTTPSARPAQLNLGGWSFRVTPPSGTAAGGSFTVRPPASPIGGLTVQSATLNTDAAGEVQTGTLTVSVALGDAVQVGSATLTVSPGGQVQTDLRGVAFRAGDLGGGTLDLTLSAAGITGAGRLDAAALHVAHGLVLTSGSLTVAVGPDGVLTGSGALGGQLTGIGPVRVAAALSENALTGGVDVGFDQPLDVGSGVRITGAELAGQYASDGLALRGALRIDVGGWAQGDVAGGYDADSGAWSASGVVAQVADKALGALTLQNGQLNVGVEGQAALPVTGRVDWQWSGGWHGSAEGAYDPATDQLSATGSAILDQEVQIGDLRVPMAAGQIGIEANALQQFDGAVSAVVPYEGADTFRVDVTSVQTSLDDLHLDGAAQVTLLRDLALRPDAPAQVTLRAGSQATGEVAGDALVHAEGALSFAVADAQGPIGSGQSTLAVDPAQGLVSGEAAFSLDTDLGFPERQSQDLVLRAGGAVTASLVDSTLDTATVDLPFAVRNPAGDGQGALEGQLGGTVDFAQGLVQGEADATLVSRWPLPVPTGLFELTEGGTASLSVVDNTLTEVSGDLPFEALVGQDPLLLFSGRLAGDLDVAQARANGAATLTLEDDAAYPDAQGQWVAEAGSTAQGDIVDNALGGLSAHLSARHEDAQGPWLAATVDVAALGDAAGLTGTAAAEVTRSTPLATPIAGFDATLEPGTGGSGQLTANTLDGLQGTLAAQLADAQGPLIAVTGAGRWEQASGAIDGGGSAELLRSVPLGQLGEYTFTAEPGAGLSATLSAGALSDISGAIHAGVADSGGPLLDLTGTGQYALDGASTLTFSGAAQIVREKEMGAAGAFVFFLTPGTGATALVEENRLVSLGGTLSTRVDFQGAPFAEVALAGSWTEETGFTGHGAAQLVCEPFEAAAMGQYSLWLSAGTGTEVDVDHNAITHLTANLPIQIKQGGQDFLVGDLQGSYDVEGRLASGVGALTVVEERQLLSAGDEQFWLLGGSGAAVTVADNTITHIGGATHMGLRDGEGQYLSVQFDGSFDTAAGRFDGGGAVTVEREKRLPTPGSPFAIAPGAGASAVIENNAVTAVSGRVPFRVYNGATPLLEGSVQGDWNASDNVINGTGDVFLASDQIFGPIRFARGSGGSAQIVDSVLQRFTGTIDAYLSDSQGELVHLTANGTFDAVNNVIEHAEGGAQMLRDWTPLPGLVISGVTGSAVLANNEIQEVHGTGQVAMDALHATGTFDANWRNDGGRDVYWGSGRLDFDWAMGSESGRGITGASVGATLHEDQSFDADGTVTYALNENMRGDVGIQVDETWDPVLSGAFQAEGTLVEGRELFHKSMQLIPHTFLNILGPFGIGFGMVGEMGLDLQPMTFGTLIGFSDFHPMNVDVPDFEASLRLDWGLNFFGALAPYVGIGAGFGPLSATAGIEGQARLDAAVNVMAEGRVFGQGGQYGGELGIGAAVTPTASLTVVPYASVNAFGLGGRWEFGEYPIASAELFTVDWSTKYTFGDAGEQASDGAGPSAPATPTTSTPAQIVSGGNGEAAPSLGGEAVAPAQKTSGGPSVSGSDVSTESGEAEGLGGILEQVDKITVVANGLDAMGRLVDLLGMSWNLPVLAVKIATNWDQIAADVNAVAAALGQVYDWIKPLLPSWFFDLQQVIADGLGVLQNAFNLVMDAGKWVAGKVGGAISAVGRFLFG